MRKICTFLICKLPCVSMVAVVLYLSVLKPLLTDGSTIFHSSQILLLFLTVVMDNFLDVALTEMRPSACQGQTAADRWDVHLRCIFKAHLGRWPASMASTTELVHLFIHLSIPVSHYFKCHMVFFVFFVDFCLHAHLRG